MLIIMCGLPATGKTTLARALARQTGAVHLRIDTIEQAIARSGPARHPVGPVGYIVGYALAEEHLRQGLTVIAESVNPLAVTRDAWREVAVRAGVPAAEVEIVCSDPAEHERRASQRTVDIPDLPLPTWTDITNHVYEPWHRDHHVIDTAGRAITDCLIDIRHAIGLPPQDPPPAAQGGHRRSDGR
ncbi:AAA family ATPase [Streptomyces rugosispiralis]|uniref:AAA family ATPase n=1 Tax=Streptomyces rugosispiralis TaxID=2967341 RepID=A0ABT1USR2_9ACTN|nr:AAA family ATPase [Streptomyces rugosispiralis]MCQ8187605.1 AAA family ATPase [Streptomyces rugosispiralis]